MRNDMKTSAFWEFVIVKVLLTSKARPQTQVMSNNNDARLCLIYHHTLLKTFTSLAIHKILLLFSMFPYAPMRVEAHELNMQLILTELAP